MGPSALALLVLLQQPAGSAPATATPAPAAAETSQDELKPNDLPVSIDRIQRALAAPPAISLKEQHPVFRLEIFGRKPTLEDILGEKFWLGPAPYGGMTHQEFMDMVTPKEFRPYAGFTGPYLVAETALTLAETWALKAAIRKYQDAKEDREREAARKEVLDALAALEKARRAAGLPDK
ncbi:MAG TPA: hypothetical protein VL484_20070 [Vicinamibacterales bacterium]|jgi:hypothetical protein|nr:hypothetical protein [Vicinamibacterales bacterium]